MVSRGPLCSLVVGFPEELAPFRVEVQVVQRPTNRPRFLPGAWDQPVELQLKQGGHVGFPSVAAVGDWRERWQEKEEEQ